MRGQLFVVVHRAEWVESGYYRTIGRFVSGAFTEKSAEAFAVEMAKHPDVASCELLTVEMLRQAIETGVQIEPMSMEGKK